MVMPRSRSMSIESSTCSLPAISRSVSPPVIWIRRSASVDLPWSICATMEKLRMLEMGAELMRAGYHPRCSAATKEAAVFSALWLVPRRFVASAQPRARLLLFLAELRRHEVGERLDRLARLGAGGGDDHAGARSGRQHHQSHDRVAADGLIVARHGDICLEALDHLHEFRRRARMQAALVGDGNLPDDSVA